MKKVLFATDGSESASKAAELAGDLLDAWPEAKLTVLYVTVRMEPQFITGWMFDDAEKYAEQLREEVLSRQFAKWRDRVEFIHTAGQPASVICETAAEENADLIVVGSHGRGAVDRLFLGSVSHGVVHRAKVPVLVAKE